MWINFRSKQIKADQSRSKQIKADQSRSKQIKADQKQIKADQKQIKADQSRSKQIKADQSNLLRVEIVHLYVNLNLMDKKLTLSLDSVVIEKAKNYAQSNGVSLSRMIENYLALLTKSTDLEEEDYSPTVSRLIGSLNLPGDLDYKKEYSDYLTEKYKLRRLFIDTNIVIDLLAQKS